MQSFINTLETEVEQCWGKIYEGPFWQHLRTHGLNRELYVCMMTQIYGYTKYNSQSQALAATKVTSERLQLLRFCLEHAFEEAGHDLMVLNDLEKIGIDREVVKETRLLPATQAFIAYLFHISTEYDATARLGYSFWAEGSYSYIEELTNAMRHDLNLPNKHMTFIIAHSEFDEKHLKDVIKAVSEWCISPQQKQDTIEVLKNTLHLTGSILDEVYKQYIENKKTQNLLQTA